ncbi:gamma-glutamyl hydrolase 1 [Stylonychia lemnae]|uniref:folate gamma-glutamyl hydrolase n=1 Tax=Stylonychia lemnae TaxID=5949 RepID=A0A078B5U2_STYLE|nr:gamma-glutamyl hydrolase 1 [Stylonychia lemnae]|eukprot:CDW89591.1 gamma-glutamyl hydrolase 1 [Stylonychia lemnae]
MIFEILICLHIVLYPTASQTANADYGAGLNSGQNTKNMLLQFERINYSSLFKYDKNKAITQMEKTQPSSTPLCNPVIGILTQPVSAGNRQNSEFDQYILDVNREFVELSGSCAVPIRYDLPENELLDLLAKINGVLFTGGALVLINRKTKEQSQYYKTAKFIFNYCLERKDKYNEHFPIFGNCQGFQVLTLIVANDNIDILEKFPALSNNRRVRWAFPNNEVKKESKFFENFSQELIDKMANNNLAYHAHFFAIHSRFYQEIESLRKFFKVIATDTLIFGFSPYTTIIEAHDYPIYAILFHPEYQLQNYTGWLSLATNKNEDTIQIANLISEFYKQESLKNEHKFENQEEFNKLRSEDVLESSYDFLKNLVTVKANRYKKQTQTS